MDVYKISIALAMSSNHNAVLSALSAQLLGVHANVNRLTGGFNSLKLAIGGALVATAGVAILKTMTDLVEKTKDYSHELAKLENLGGAMGMAAANGDLSKRAFDIAQRVPSSVTDLLKIPGVTNSLLGPEMSMAMWEPMAKLAFVLQNQAGSTDTGADLNKLIRAGELSGRFTDPATGLPSQERMAHFFDMATKIISATHGLVNAQTLFAMSNQGGVALRGLTDEGFYTQAIMAQAMGGHRAGTAYLSLWQQMAGGTMFKRTAEGMEDVGLLGKDEWYTDHGRVILGPEASQRLTKLIGKDPLDLAANLVEHFKNQGITDPMEQMRLTLRALGRQTTQRYTAEEVANFHQMIAERDRMKQGFGAGDSFNTFMNKDVSANLLALSNAWNNLLTAVAGPNSENVIAILHKLTGAINYMTQQVNQTDPQTITKIAEAIGVLGVALTGAGAVAILAALGPAGWVAGIAIGLAATAAAFPKVREALVAIPTALNDAIDFVVKALGTVASRIAEAINKLGHSILGSAEGIAKGGAGGAGGNYDQMGNPTGAPMRFVPGTDGKLKAQPISMSLNVDGRTLAQAISEQLEYLYEHQTGASAADGSRGYPGNAPFTAA